MDAHTRCATLTGYPELARSLGLDPRRLMARVGLDIADLDHPDQWIPAAPVARLLELSAREAGREDIGLLLANLRRLSTLGPLGLVLAQEPDLRTALDLLIRYEDVYTGVLDLRLLQDGPVTVEVWLDFGEPVPLRQASELVAAAAVGIIRGLVGQAWEPRAACFAHAAPADPATHRRIFGPRLRFDQPFTGLVLATADLDLPVLTYEPALRPYTRRFLHAVTEERSETIADPVAGLIELLLPTGQCSASHVSRMLATTPRTLHRQLALQGRSFSAVLHATRATLAERYLAIDRYSLTDVSQLLGFAASSAFSRWFRQQFGMSPTEWRASTHTPAGV